MDNIELENLKVEATAGNADAQYELGEVYYWGKGVPEDKKEAIKWFRMGADQGHADAQYSLGFMYYWGKGVPIDHDEAIQWYLKAADQSHVLAQSALSNTAFGANY